MRPVVVGVPDSREPTAALHRAVHEARSRGLPLTVVHGLASPFGKAPTDQVLAAVRARLRDAVGECSGSDLEVELVLSDAEATPALLSAAEAAALLVVGGRSREVAGRHLLGTVSGGCLQGAVCPVMVVPAAAPLAPPRGRVVVAVDEGGPSHAALAWAVAQSRTSGATLDAVAVCPPGRDPLGVRTSVSRALQDAAGVLRPEDLQVLEGQPVDAIASCLTINDLLVVGSRGHGSLLGLLLASTSAALVARAVCPTVVVRAGQARRELHGATRGTRSGDVGPSDEGRSPLLGATPHLMG
jgi:nucleotide-binding universal stress UspA family protein